MESKISTEKTNERIDDQDFILLTMEALNYVPNPSGICLAYAQIGAEEFLSGNTDSFDAMIDLLYVVYKQAFEKSLQKLNISNLKLKDLDEKSLESIKTNLKQLFNELPDEKQQMMRIFFQKIIDIYERQYHLEEKPSASDSTSPVDKPNTFYGSTEILDKSLHRLSELLEGTGVRIAMTLRNCYESNHATAIGYDSAISSWRLFDANHASMRTLNRKLLAEKMIMAESGIEQVPNSSMLQVLTANFDFGVLASKKDAAKLKFIGFKWNTEVSLLQKHPHWVRSNNSREKNAAFCFLYEAVKASNSTIQIEKMVTAFQRLESAEDFIQTVKSTLADTQIQALKNLDMSAMYVQFVDPSVTTDQRFDRANMAAFMLFKKIYAIVYPKSPQSNLTSILEDFIRNLPEKNIKRQKISAILDQLSQAKYNDANLAQLIEKVERIIGENDRPCQIFCNFFRTDKFIEQAMHFFNYNCG